MTLSLVAAAAVWMVTAFVLWWWLDWTLVSSKIDSRSRRPHSNSWHTLAILVHCYNLGILHDWEVVIAHTSRIAAEQQWRLHSSVEREH